jgi:hypothetical protein
MFWERCYGSYSIREFVFCQVLSYGGPGQSKRQVQGVPKGDVRGQIALVTNLFGFFIILATQRY